MDAIVEAALRKWPGVPHCYGWLALDARGQWFMRDERIRAAGPFARVRGNRIEHLRLLEFIARNYACDERGCWFFQNGPQRVYVELEAAPWIWRLDPGGDVQRLRSHTGRGARVQVQAQSCWLDESGRLFIATDLGLGLVHTQDMHLAAQAVEAGCWVPQDTRFGELPQRYAYVLEPVPAEPPRDGA